MALPSVRWEKGWDIFMTVKRWESLAFHIFRTTEHTDGSRHYGQFWKQASDIRTALDKRWRRFSGRIARQLRYDLSMHRGCVQNTWFKKKKEYLYRQTLLTHHIPQKQGQRDWSRLLATLCILSAQDYDTLEPDCHPSRWTGASCEDKRTKTNTWNKTVHFLSVREQNWNL